MTSFIQMPPFEAPTVIVHDGKSAASPPLLVHDAVPPYVKHQLIRRVYAILSLQLLVTTGLVLCALSVDSIAAWIAHPSHAWMQTSMLLATLVTICVLMPLAKHRVPWNGVLLWMFTCMQSYLVAHVCVTYRRNGLGSLVLSSMEVTGVVVLALTVYVWRLKTDFEWIAPALTTTSLLMVPAILLSVISGEGGFLVSALGIVLFVGFLLYDTASLATRFGPDDAIEASLQLYVDIVGLFLTLLDVLRVGAVD